MKRKLIRLVAGSVILAAALVLKLENPLPNFVLYFAAYLVIGSDILLRSARNIARGQWLDENFLMSIATVGAFVIGEYFEGVLVMWFFQVGDFFQSYAVNRSRKSIADLMDIRPDHANVHREGEIIRVDPDEVTLGETIIIRAGERVPLDGIIIEGNSNLDTSALTGESVPREVGPGSEVLSGCINVNGLLTVEVTKEFYDSTVSKILDLVENAVTKKAQTENFITRFARHYTPAVVGLATIISLLPPLFIPGASFYDWIYRGLTFLVISCPCALVVSIPLTFFGGIGGASRKGILVKGSNYLEALSQMEVVVFDKTGTLTHGVFNVQEVHGVGITADKLLEIAAHAEAFSNHPIASSLKRAYSRDIDNSRIGEVEEISGHGVRAIVDGQEVLAGNARFMHSRNVAYEIGEVHGTVVLVAVEGTFLGHILIADEIKEDAREAVRSLRDAGIKKLVMLTGDAKVIGEKVGRDLGLDMVFAELLPGDKVDKVEELLANTSAQGKLAFVGDGINDAPVLTRSDVGIAMGALGSDAAIEAADVVIMTDEPSKIATGIRVSQKTLGIVRQNIFFSLGIKFAVMLLATLGFASMIAGIFADVGVLVLTVFNSMRALNVENF
ncbi:MAG: cadmium-translocating P-type ATPase [Symbiobacteriaceae bacterium]|nr:cadmium-translocating P-type ATPase [Symbiobacteriaceae bacterium]